MTILVKYVDDKKIMKLYKRHYGSDNVDSGKIIYGLYKLEMLVGYVVYIIDNDVVILEWIYAPGYGKVFMKKLELDFINSGIKKIILKFSVDPNENKKSVMRRMNFYIGLQYRVYDIEYREHYGPLLHMEKYLKKLTI